MVEAPGTIGRYAVERLLGQGGMGRVWLARDTVLGRAVAIKVLRDDLSLAPAVREELSTRMRHEAQAAAAVSHPNIVTLYDMGEDDAVGLYLVFEYVPAAAAKGGKDRGPESLRDRLTAGPLPLSELARLARELGSALAFAHDAGVIHRDVKPENILFARTGAKIADFGIARIPESNITRANTVLGTPAYTAPEALSHGEFGPMSDQFSLAATLYEALTGVRAFGSGDPIVTAGKVSNDAPPPLEASLGSSAQLRALSYALTRGLAKDASKRFPTCLELGEAVARAVERPPASDAPPPDVTISEKIEIERTPLSSRTALVERASRMVGPSLTPIAGLAGDTVRPSVFIRQKKTERVQNIAAGVALLVIVGLVVFGRRQDESAAAHDAARAATSLASSTASARPAAPPHPTPRASHAQSAVPRPAPSAHDSGAADGAE